MQKVVGLEMKLRSLERFVEKVHKCPRYIHSTDLYTELNVGLLSTNDFCMFGINWS